MLIYIFFTWVFGQTLNSNNDIIIYPNPSSGMFTLAFNLLENEYVRLKVYNVMGEIIYLENLNHKDKIFRKQIDISGFAGGIYYLSLNYNNKTIGKKIIKY